MPDSSNSIRIEPDLTAHAAVNVATRGRRDVVKASGVVVKAQEPEKQKDGADEMKAPDLLPPEEQAGALLRLISVTGDVP